MKLIGIVLAIALFLFPAPAFAQATKYYPPPLSYSNAELPGRDFSGQTLRSAEFSNANLQQTNFSNADVRGTIFSTSSLKGANLHGADLSYGMADWVDFTGADLSDAIFNETLLLVSTFHEVNITGADFTDAILDGKQIEELCAIASGVNSKTGVATRDSLLCP
ncbi:pentapeptide repeat-containing protein [Oscillatoria sp. FACHB-1406]|uniref:pentapeptide repeat-containing protein n=1 Tax=Oscillatoria sp. FACHB-1406 TaxID=2692846 RepID=UPI0016889934|nr:pentapeptide repeat-containing protein [Oscillatoria sp. FACHB-1406]MBD2579424.1 pentapeptide repeat-containing protein [Oscillatoria sp. FACHB-1406]